MFLLVADLQYYDTGHFSLNLNRFNFGLVKKYIFIFYILFMEM